MTLDEAIKYLRADKSGVVFNEQARQLGIEALEWIKWRRAHYKLPPILPLPSETEEAK